MSQLSLAATTSANLAEQISLNCWYKIENNHLIQTNLLPKTNHGVASVAFGCEFSAAKLLNLVEFLSQHGFIVSLFVDAIGLQKLFTSMVPIQ